MPREAGLRRTLTALLALAFGLGALVRVASPHEPLLRAFALWTSDRTELYAWAALALLAQCALLARPRPWGTPALYALALAPLAASQIGVLRTHAELQARAFSLVFLSDQARYTRVLADDELASLRLAALLSTALLLVPQLALALRHRASVRARPRLDGAVPGGLLSLSLLLSGFASYALPGALAYVAVALVLSGILLLEDASSQALAAPPDEAPAAQQRARWLAAAVLLHVLLALSVAYTLLPRPVAESTSVPFAFGAVLALWGATVALASLLRPGRWRAGPPEALYASLAGAFALGALAAVTVVNGLALERSERAMYARFRYLDGQGTRLPRLAPSARTPLLEPVYPLGVLRFTAAGALSRHDGYSVLGPVPMERYEYDEERPNLRPAPSFQGEVLVAADEYTPWGQVRTQLSVQAPSLRRLLMLLRVEREPAPWGSNPLAHADGFVALPFALRRPVARGAMLTLFVALSELRLGTDYTDMRHFVAGPGEGAQCNAAVREMLPLSSSEVLFVVIEPGVLVGRALRVIQECAARAEGPEHRVVSLVFR